MNKSIFLSVSDRLAKTVLGMAIALLLLGPITTLATAQDEKKAAADAAAGADASTGRYLEDVPNPNLQKNFKEVKRILSQEKFANAGEKQLVEDYIENYELKRWTLAANFHNVSTWRAQLRALSKKPGQPHDRLNELLLDILSKKIKNKKYGPVFLVNGVLTIGELNAVEGSFPTPMSQAMPVLLEVLGGVQEPDYMKAAALAGIRRHVVAGVKDPNIATAVFKLASTKDTDPVKMWMQKRAIEILGLLGAPGQGNQVVNLLQSIIADKKAEIQLRWLAAEALGQINLSNAAGLNADPLIAAVKQLMKEGCEAALKKKTADEIKRTVKCYMQPVLAALGDSSKKIGIASLPNAPGPKITELQKLLNRELLTALDKEDANDEDIEKAVEDALKKL